MKKIFIPILLCFFSFLSFSQKKTIYITTNTPISYQVFIDDELQYYGIQSDYKISNISAGKKILKIQTYTNSNQRPSIEINTSDAKDEYYVINKEGDKYVISKNDLGFKFKSGTIPAAVNFISKRPPVKIDSTKKHVNSCKMSDSSFKVFYGQINELKDQKSRELFLTNRLKRTCLTTSQIRSLGYRIDSDSEKFNMYQKYHATCIDNGEFRSLEKTFKTQEYATKFMAWLDLKSVSE